MPVHDIDMYEVRSCLLDLSDLFPEPEKIS